MKRLVLPLLLTLLQATALPAQADRLPLPTNTPASFKDECSSCHMAFQPALLSAGEWQRTMAGLKDHFGTDATLDAKAAQEIGAFLQRNAGNAGKLGAGGEPPRITRTERFIRKHREVAPRYWSDPRIKTAANCESCHTGAAQGNYSEHDVAIRELRR